MPGPSSVTVSRAWPSLTSAASGPPRVAACRTALSTRLDSTRRSSVAVGGHEHPGPGRRRRTGTGAAAYRPATSASSGGASKDSRRDGRLRVGAGPGQQQQVLDQRDRRCTSASRSAGRSPPSPSRCATSSWVRMRASGLRSSCAASATKARCRSRRAGQPVEHVVEGGRQGVDLVRGVGHRQPLVLAGAADPLGAGAQRLDRAERAPDDPPGDDRERRPAAAGR